MSAPSPHSRYVATITEALHTGLYDDPPDEAKIVAGKDALENLVEKYEVACGDRDRFRENWATAARLLDVSEDERRTAEEQLEAYRNALEEIAGELDEPDTEPSWYRKRATEVLNPATEPEANVIYDNEIVPDRQSVVCAKCGHDSFVTANCYPAISPRLSEDGSAADSVSPLPQGTPPGDTEGGLSASSSSPSSLASISDYDPATGTVSNEREMRVEYGDGPSPAPALERADELVCTCGGPARGNLNFDRSICACGAMHYFCDECGFQAEPCDERSPASIHALTTDDSENEPPDLTTDDDFGI